MEPREHARSLPYSSCTGKRTRVKYQYKKKHQRVYCKIATLEHLRIAAGVDILLMYYYY